MSGSLLDRENKVRITGGPVDPIYRPLVALGADIVLRKAGDAPRDLRFTLDGEPVHVPLSFKARIHPEDLDLLRARVGLKPMRRSA